MPPTKIQDGVVVTLEYTLKLEDGEVIDETTPEDLLVYLHGADNVIPGLEKALVGLAVGAQKQVVVAPEDAYGDYDPEDVEELERSMFEDAELEEGEMVLLHDDEGNEFEAEVVELTKDTVTLDFNHPLAGETLYFDVKIVALRDATPDELAHGHAH